MLLVYPCILQNYYKNKNKKSGLLVSSEKYCILLFFGGKYVRNTTFDFMLVKV